MNLKTDLPTSKKQKTKKNRYLLGAKKTRTETRQTFLERHFKVAGVCVCVCVSRAGGLTVGQVDGLNVHQGLDLYLLEVWELWVNIILERIDFFYRGLVSLDKWAAIQL